MLEALIESRIPNGFEASAILLAIIGSLIMTCPTAQAKTAQSNK
jgi:hypothetical protein